MEIESSQPTRLVDAEWNCVESCDLFFFPPSRHSESANFLFLFIFALYKGTGVLLDLKIMGMVELYYKAEDFGSTLETVQLDLSPCEVVHAILL